MLVIVLIYTLALSASLKLEMKNILSFCELRATMIEISTFLYQNYPYSAQQDYVNFWFAPCLLIWSLSQTLVIHIDWGRMLGTAMVNFEPGT